MGQNDKSDSNDIHAQTAALIKMQRELTSRKLTGGQTPAHRSAALAQQAARVDLAAARNKASIAGTLAAIAGQIGFGDCALDVPALRGALLLIKHSAADKEKVAEYRRADAAFQAGKRRIAEGVRGVIVAARPSAELIDAGKALGLRRDLLAGGLVGRASPEAFAKLGHDFNCTVRVSSEGELVTLVIDGVVDEDVLSLILGQAQEPAEPDIAPHFDTEQVTEVPPQQAQAAAEPAAAGAESTDMAEGAEGQAVAGAAESAGTPRSGGSTRKPLGLPLGRTFVTQKDDSAT